MLACAGYHVSIHGELIGFQELDCNLVHAANRSVVKFDGRSQNVLDALSQKLLLLFSCLVVDLGEELNKNFCRDGRVPSDKRHKRH